MKKSLAVAEFFRYTLAVTNPTKTYRCSSPLREVKIATSKIECLLQTPSGILRINRIEAANSLRYARAKGFVSLIK
jgi:hypothetical protein